MDILKVHKKKKDRHWTRTNSFIKISTEADILLGAHEKKRTLITS